MMLAALLAIALPAFAHIGSKDVFEEVNAGPYKLFVDRPATRCDSGGRLD